MSMGTVGCVPLAALHGRSIAVRVSVLGQDRLLKGRGAYELDADLGQVLRIESPSPEDGELILAEDDFSGAIGCGEALGCEFLIYLN